ncbi:MAG: glucose-6-phosphate dehydrogenase [Geminicoccaceae bacterium]
MTAQFLPVAPFDIVVVGGTGDLAMRKLLPGLYHRDQDGQLSPDSRIIGAARRDLSRDEYQTLVSQSLDTFVSANDRDAEVDRRILQRLDYAQVDATSDEVLETLTRHFDDARDRVRIFYLATGPSLFGKICHELAASGLITPATRVVLEKPLGHDSASARTTNEAVGEVLGEDQIFRIDHYLGKETVQNLMTLRFANLLFEPIWNASAIDHIQITVAETIGVGDRGGYYDRAGATRDMIQNHLLQLLCMVAMEPPSAFDADAVRDEKLKVLRALKPIGSGEIDTMTVRGQYRGGAIDDQVVQSYADESGIPDSLTETFVVVKAEVENWRWKGVPIYLRTGKRLAARHSEIVVAFREVPHSIFGDATQQISANRLVLRLQPDEAVKLFLMTKDPGPGGLRLKNVPLNLTYADTFLVRYPDAYERLLMDVVRGNPTLFMRKDEVDAAWAWVDPMLDAWAASGKTPKPYTAGSWGPSDATALMAKDDRRWHEDMG